MLYAPEAHEPPTGRRWDAAWVRDAIGAIVAATDAAYADLWPAEEWDAYSAEHLPLKNLYCGAAGVVWALAELRPHAESALDLAAVAQHVLERFRSEPDWFTAAPLPDERSSSLFGGETGVAFVAYKLAPTDELRRRLVELVDANLANPANELMWGVPGTLLVARALDDTAAVRASEAALREARDADGLWTQRLYGETFRALGPIHGYVGNLAALDEADDGILRSTAIREGEHVNWPPAPDDLKLRLQWCHGAPGILATASAYLDEDLLLGGAQLIWDAGPSDGTEKGAGLCHGTAGNGYGLLKAFERTRDELWLERARAFAVHAIEQVQRLPPRHSLFTGGVGAALFAADCLDAVPRFPVVDRL
ncbi:MAG TPA: LanC-like protein [Gaiellaceae bacterium]|nr:LanC-like protein [Gaiellaceae bacterium]